MSSLHSLDQIWMIKKRKERGQFSPVPEPFLFTVDISHMLKLQTAPKNTLASCIYNLRNH